MKRVIIYLISVLNILAFAACQQEEDIQNPTLEPITESISAKAEAGHYEILYKLTDPSDNLKIYAESEQEWIGNFTYGETKVAFDVAENESESERSGIIKVSYGNLGFEVAVNQAAKGNEEPPIDDIEYDNEVECTVFEGAYYGNAYSGDRYGYGVHIATDRSYYENGYPDINGIYYTFEMYGPEPSNLNDIFLPAGTYTFDKENSFGEYTILAGELEEGVLAGSIYINKEKKYFESGTVTVKREGSENICDIELKATLSDGTTHHAKFRGMDLFIDSSIKWLQNNISMTNIEYFQATYLEDNYRNTNINIKITDSPLTDTGYLTVPGNVLTFVGNVELLDNGMPKPGTWTISAEEETPINGLWQGECVRFGAPFPVGVVLESYDKEGNVTVGLADRGTVNISGGGDNYVMTWDIVTKNRKNITGTYTGPIVVAGAPVVDTTLLDSDYELQLENLTVTSCYLSWSGILKIDLAYMEPVTYNYIGDNLRISITPTEGMEGPEPGVYKVSTTNEPGSVIAGSFDINNPVESVYLEFNENGKIIRGASVRDGELELIKNNDGTWTINFDFLDGQKEPKRFYGSWTGTLYDLGKNPWL